MMGREYLSLWISPFEPYRFWKPHVLFVFFLFMLLGKIHTLGLNKYKNVNSWKNGFSRRGTSREPLFRDLVVKSIPICWQVKIFISSPTHCQITVKKQGWGKILGIKGIWECQNPAGKQHRWGQSCPASLQRRSQCPMTLSPREALYPMSSTGFSGARRGGKKDIFPCRGLAAHFVSTEGGVRCGGLALERSRAVRAAAWRGESRALVSLGELYFCLRLIRGRWPWTLSFNSAWELMKSSKGRRRC